MTNVLINDQGKVRNGWKAVSVFAGYIVFGIIFSLTIRTLGIHLPKWLPTPWVAFLGALIPSLLWLRSEGRGAADMGYRLDGRWAGEFALGTLFGFAIMVGSALVVFGVGGFHWTRTPDVGAGTLLAGAWLYLSVAFHEETLCRGYPFQRMTDGMGFNGAQWTMAGVFALMHWGNPGMHGATKIWATINIGLAAILLGLCWRRTGSLALPIGVHLGWNWTQGSLLGFGVSGTTAKGLWTPVFHDKPEWLTGGAFGLEASLPATVVIAACCVALALWKGTSPAAAEAVSAPADPLLGNGEA